MEWKTQENYEGNFKNGKKEGRGVIKIIKQSF